MNPHRTRGARSRVWFARGCDPRLIHAFTLLEILVVLAIIGLLVGLAIVNVGGAHQSAEEATARLMVRNSFKTSLSLYRFAMGEYPSTTEGLQALVIPPAGKTDRWRPVLEDKLPNDPWGQPYNYVYPGRNNKDGYDLWSKGKDKQNGTADDITNWDRQPPGT